MFFMIEVALILPTFIAVPKMQIKYHQQLLINPIMCLHQLSGFPYF